MVRVGSLFRALEAGITTVIPAEKPSCQELDDIADKNAFSGW